jgi:hypothetical protein
MMNLLTNLWIIFSCRLKASPRACFQRCHCSSGSALQTLSCIQKSRRRCEIMVDPVFADDGYT